ncbi:MAG: T9SS type A sorting domain-containing protein [Bacteroidales bacterium]|nr:T9SS type A sorting domain-containing protein [Bacteroidales bacterium]
MKITSWLIGFLLMICNLLNAQNVSFELLLEKSNVRVSPGAFIENQFGELVGPIIFKEYTNDTISRRYSRLLSIDSEGDTSSINFEKQDTLFSVVLAHELQDEIGGYLLWGSYYFLPSGATRQIEVFIRIDYQFNIIWEKSFDFGFNYVAPGRKILQDESNDILIACSPDSHFEMYLLRLSPNGDSLDFRHYTGDSAGSIQSLTYNFDSTVYLLHTYGSHYQQGVSENRIIEINKDLEQTNVLNYPDWYNLSFETQLWPDNKFISAGDETVFSGGELKHYFTAYLLNDDLSIPKMKRLTNPDTLSTSAWYRNMDIVGNSYIYVGGSFSGFYHSSNDTTWYYIAMFDENLDLIYEKYIGGDKHYWCECITATDDGGVFMSGVLFDVDSLPIMHKAYLVKIDTTGLPVKIDQPAHLNFYDALIYPNPGKDYINIRTTLKNYCFELFDITGNLVINQAINNHITQINTKHLLTGTYVYFIRNKNTKIQSGKWIKQ